MIKPSRQKFKKNTKIHIRQKKNILKKNYQIRQNSYVARSTRDIQYYEKPTRVIIFTHMRKITHVVYKLMDYVCGQLARSVCIQIYSRFTSDSQIYTHYHCALLCTERACYNS